MLIPISDENTYLGRPVVTYVLIAANILVYVIVNLVIGVDAAFPYVALRPDKVELHALFTSVFVHAGILHLASNMLFLWIVGDNVEMSFGRITYVAFYLGTGLIAGIFHIIMNLDSEQMVVGASGAIAGVLAAYLVLYPENRIRFWYWFGYLYYYFWCGTFQVRAKFAIGAYFVLQLIYISFTGAGSNVSYEAHIGGGLAGAGLTFLFLYLEWAERDRPHAWVRPPSSSHPRKSRKEERASPEASRSAPPMIPRIPRRIRARAHRRLPRGMKIVDPDAYTLIRADDSPIETLPIGKLISKEMGCPLVDVTTRISVSSGFLCGEIPKETAERLLPMLAEAGVPALAVPLKDLENLPRAILLRGVKVHASGLDTRTEWEEFSILWGEIRLVACGQIRTEKLVRKTSPQPSRRSLLSSGPFGGMMGMPTPSRSRRRTSFDTVHRNEVVIDLYHTDSKLRFRFWQGRFRLDGIKVARSADAMQMLAQRIVEKARGPALSPALTALAQKKDISAYSFPNRSLYEGHNQYLFLLERHAPEILRGGRGRWLEL
ncbi:MAG: rhomboid family intramembrane serine protease [Planctomycetota bacterium]|nr:rhomboid family intramembrane serine protease [Planctomycetota bacterium]